MPRVNLVNCCLMLSLQELALNAALVTATHTRRAAHQASNRAGIPCEIPPSTSPYRCSLCTGSWCAMLAWHCMNAASFS